MLDDTNTCDDAALTPCVGRCSTVFGDNVCRGCRRFNHEVIEWNRYSPAQKKAVWQRLDQQLDQIILPLLPDYDKVRLIQFLNTKRVRLPTYASAGRQVYHALKLCEKMPHLIDESGLGVQQNQIKSLWQKFEQRVLLLANASYELAWLRANYMHDAIEDDSQL